MDFEFLRRSSRTASPSGKQPERLEGRAASPAAVTTRARRGWIDGSELAIFVAFAGLSIWVLALVVGRAIAVGRIWTGTDGVGLQDQMQYLAWIRDTSRHVLASNLFVLSPTPHDYLQPLVAISGLLTAMGVPAWLTLLMWKPVAVVAIFFAIRTYVHRVVIGAPQRLTALVLALFFVGPGLLIANAIRHLGLSGRLDFEWHDVTLDPWIGWWSWGYPFGLIGLASMMAAVLAYSREREEQRAIHLSPILGGLAAWLHPWQGATLIVILLVCEIGDFVGPMQESVHVDCSLRARRRRFRSSTTPCSHAATTHGDSARRQAAARGRSGFSLSASYRLSCPL